MAENVSLPEGFEIVEPDALPSGFEVKEIDRTTGAPLRVRTSVGAAPTETKLSTLQQYYPDAQPFGEDNFIFTNPDSGALNVYNPEGYDIGDISEDARMIAEFFGSAIGGAIPLVLGQAGPQVAVPEEAVTVPAGAALGASIAGQAYDKMADVFFPQVEKGGVGPQVDRAVIDITSNIAGYRLGELAEKGIKEAAKGGARLARSGADDLVKAFDRMAIEPTAAMISGSRTLQGIENSLAKLPITSDIYGKKYNAVIDGMSAYARNIASDLSKISGKQQVGLKIKQDVERFSSQFTKSASELYDKVDQYIPKGSKVTLTNFKTALDDISGSFDNDPQFKEFLDSPLIAKLKAAASASDEVSYQTLKSLRTKIGEKIGDSGLVADASRGELKKLYSALSDDLSMAASQSGPEAIKAASRANNYWNAGRKRIDDILQPIVNKAEEHQIYNAVLSGAKDSGQRLLAVKKSIGNQAFNDMKAQVIRELGRAKAGAQDATGELFSPATFMTNYNNLSPSAKKVLFGGNKLDKPIENLVKTSAAVKDMATMANTSGTAQQVIFMEGLLGGVGAMNSAFQGGDPLKGAAELATTGAMVMSAPVAVAKLMTNPKFVQWLADSSKVTMTQNGIGSYMGRLVGIAESEPEISNEIQEYMRVLQGESGNN